MPRFYTEERDLIESLLQDPTNLTWSTAELDDLISEGLLELSRYVPYEAKLTLLTRIPMDDLIGAVNALTLADSKTLVVKALGTGKVPKGTTFLIAGDTTIYTVTDTVTISANIATLYISPALVAQAVENAVVTFTEAALTTAITLSAEDKRNLLWVDKLEYLQEYRHFIRVHDTLTMDDLERIPATNESVYLYVAKKHILNPAMDAPLGAVNANTAQSSKTLVVKELGTGKVPEDTTFVIKEDTTVYTVIDTATIATNIATLYINPFLVKATALDRAVTFTEADSTLDADLEILLANLVAANALINKGAKYINTIAVTSRDALQQYLATGNAKLAKVLRELRGKRRPRTKQLYPTA